MGDMVTGARPAIPVDAERSEDGPPQLSAVMASSV